VSLLFEEASVLIRNFHARSLPATREQIGGLVDALAGPDDPLWPTDHWPPMRFDRPLGVGAEGGHGAVRYTVVGYIPGEWIRFQFNGSGGLVGFHEVTVRPDGADRVELSHLLAAAGRGRALLRWALVMRWLHDACVEEMLDRAEFAATGAVRNPVRWGLHVRLLRRVMRRRTPAVQDSPLGV
jgi:hypothetical protein